jgi:hypothetical protein
VEGISRFLEDWRFEISDGTFFLKNNPTKLLKTQGGVPKSDKTIPISDTFGGITFRVAMGGENGGGNQPTSHRSKAIKFILKNKATKLSKTQAGCPESDKTNPILGRTNLRD